MAASPKVRLSLELTDDANERLEAMAESIGGTKSEVLRRALTLMELAIQGRRNGQHLGFTDKSENLKREIIGL